MSRAVPRFCAVSIHISPIPPISSFSVAHGANGLDLQITSTPWWSMSTEQDVGKAPTEPPRSVSLLMRSFCPHHFTARKLNRWHLSGVANLWDGDGREVHIGAQPVRVLNGVHHSSRLPWAAEPWLTLPSCTYRAVEQLHLWVILLNICRHTRGRSLLESALDSYSFIQTTPQLWCSETYLRNLSKYALCCRWFWQREFARCERWQDGLINGLE